MPRTSASTTAPRTPAGAVATATDDRPDGGLPAAGGTLGRIAGVAAEVGRGAAGVGSALLPGARGRAVRRWSRSPARDLDDRDSYLLRDLMPLSWALCSAWFRASVHGLHHVPQEGPVLLVGNHSGGTLSPDSIVFTTAFVSRFGPERALYLLVHGTDGTWPIGGLLRRLGVLPACRETAAEALAAGSCVLVYPGGERELHRPSWESARIDLGDPADAVRLALEAGAPIVPVVALGGQETALFLGPLDRLVGRRLPARLRPRLPATPVALAAPWGVNVGRRLAQLPLPAKIAVQVLPAIDPVAQFGRGSRRTVDPEEVARHLEATMAEMLEELQRRRRLPVVG